MGHEPEIFNRLKLGEVEIVCLLPLKHRGCAHWMSCVYRTLRDRLAQSFRIVAHAQVGGRILLKSL